MSIRRIGYTETKDGRNSDDDIHMIVQASAKGSPAFWVEERSARMGFGMVYGGWPLHDQRIGLM